MLQHVEVALLHHFDDALWHTTRRVLGMCLRLYRVRSHLGDHALSQVYGHPTGNLQEVCNHVPSSHRRAVLQRLWRRVQRLEELNATTVEEGKKANIVIR